MNWKNYEHISGHAFLSPSRYHWLNYDRDKLMVTYRNHKKAALGTRYHKVASELIKLALRLPNTEASINSFVNDAIGFKMDSEVMLYYSPNCYGTADAISFHKRVLRIHDLKTGISPGAMGQLIIYAGLFCLDYSLKANELEDVFLRIYQESELIEYHPTVDDIFDVVQKIVESDKIVMSIDSDGVL